MLLEGFAVLCVVCPPLALRRYFVFRASFSLVHTYADQLTQSPRFKFYKVCMWNIREVGNLVEHTHAVLNHSGMFQTLTAGVPFPVCT